MSDDRLRQWHRLFGIALTDLFAGSAWQVVLEQELALHSQLLDVVIIERGATAEVPLVLPDGLESLRPHNLLTYKSRHEALDGWALDELLGHYVNYRKLTAVSGRYLPCDHFGLYAVATRTPRTLLTSATPTESPGVYDLSWGSQPLRLIVLDRIAPHPRNAPWELFANERTRLRLGVRHYRRRDPARWALLERLYLAFLNEDPEMAYTMEEFMRETQALLLERLPLDEVLKHYAPDEVLKRYDPDARLKGLDVETRLKGLDVETRLKGLDPDVIAAWLARQRRDH